MPWLQVGNNYTLRFNWQVTEVVEGSFFRLKLAGLPMGETILVAQAQLEENNLELCNIYELQPGTELLILEFEKPSCFTNRRIAFRRKQPQPTVEEQLRKNLEPRVLVPLGRIAIPQRVASTINVEVFSIDPVTPEPTSPKVSVASTKTYTVAQSTTYNELTATYANLNDQNGTTGGATNTGVNQFIKADFGTPVLVSGITLGGGSLPNWGVVATYLNNRIIQFSTDDANWTNAYTVTGIADTGTSQFVKTVLNPSIEARYWRLFVANNYIATTEFRFE